MLILVSLYRLILFLELLVMNSPRTRGHCECTDQRLWKVDPVEILVWEIEETIVGCFGLLFSGHAELGKVTFGACIIVLLNPLLNSHYYPDFRHSSRRVKDLSDITSHLKESVLVIAKFQEHAI